MTKEELLNKLIEKGWKPFGKNAYNCCDNSTRIWYEGGEESYRDYIEITPRKLVSKESGLWQFVCENGMVKKRASYWTKKLVGRNITKGLFADTEFEYFIIESALTDEDKLEDFILSNIKLD